MTYKLSQLSYCRSKVQEPCSHSSCSKTKFAGRRAPAQNSPLHNELMCRELVRNAFASTTRSRHCNWEEYWKAWCDFFRQAFLHIPTCIQVSSIIFKCPTPATASSTMQPPKGEEFPLKSDTGETSFSSDMMNKLLWTSSMSIQTLNIPSLKYRGFFFWLFYLKVNLEMLAVHSCHRGVLLKKKVCETQCLFWEKLWERTLTEGKLIQDLTVLK